MLIESVFAKRSVDALDEGIAIRFARLDVLQNQPMGNVHYLNVSPKNVGPLFVRMTLARPSSRLICSNLPTNSARLNASAVGRQV